MRTTTSPLSAAEMRPITSEAKRVSTNGYSQQMKKQILEQEEI